VGLGRVEGLEDALEVALGDPGPVIAHRHDHAALVIGGGGDEQVPLHGILHGVEPIEDEVEHHLLELDAVADHDGQPRRQRDRERDVPENGVAPDEARHVSTTAFMSTKLRCASSLRTNARSRRITLPARRSSDTMSARMDLSS
jgi:hypothetical protein